MMREAHPLERAVGMEYYVSDVDGTGGTLRGQNEQFRVREIERFDAEPVDADAGAYPHLLVRATLHGWDTNDFAARLSNQMGISRERVSWAGTKDKRAVTTQLFTLAKVDPDQVPNVSDAELEIVGRTGRAIWFGDLAGNEFEIVVSEPEEPGNATQITEELAAFGGGEATGSGGRVGVPNFFGQQRFGSYRPVTHEIGLRVASREWEDAVLAYAGNPAETEPEESREARAFVEEAAEDRDWQAALDRLPRRLGFERTILHKLVENGGERPEHFREALEELPTNLQRLFVNAAQSYAFNRILSERLERGIPFDRAVPGDVVCFADTEAPDGLSLPDTDRLQRVTERRVDTVNRHCERGRAFVTAPLVGTETELSDGEPGDIEREVLADLGIEPADFDLPGEFHSTGTRRAALVQTDLELTDDPLTFQFALPKGSYATVFMREYLKTNPVEMG